jgi:hypothetical protein
MTMFSFGSIKFNTAFFGAITIVKERQPYSENHNFIADDAKEI